MSDLKSFIERVKALVAEKIALDEDIKEVLEEADEAGFDKSAIRKVATIAAKQSALKIAKERAKLDEYAAQIGLDFDMPTGIPGGKKDHGRAAPRAAGTAPAESPSPPPESGVLRPGTDPASPDPAKCCDCADDIEPLHAMVHGGVRPLCRRCFDLRDGDAAKYPGLTKLRAEQRAKNDSEPPDIPPFLDRRAKGEEAPA